MLPLVMPRYTIPRVAHCTGGELPMLPLVDGEPAPGESWEELAEHSLTHDDLPAEAPASLLAA